MTRRLSVEIALAVLITVAAAFYARAAYVPTWADRHVASAEERMALEVGEPPAWFSAWSLGDGQAFAVIAADPSGVRLSQVVGEPAYRFSRAGFGWLAWAISMGREVWIPYSMAVVGALAVFANTALALRLRRRLGSSSWLLILNPAVYLAFAGDTAEGLGAFFLTLALATGSKWSSAALGVTRPSYLIGLLGQGRPLWTGVGAAVGLALYSLLRFGAEGFTVSGGRLDLPLRAYWEHSTPYGWILAVAAAVTLVVGVWRRDWTWVIAGVFVLSFGPAVTAEPVNAWRAAGMLPVLWAFGSRYKALAPASTVGEPVPAPT
jgi:hypothetical protein